MWYDGSSDCLLSIVIRYNAFSTKVFRIGGGGGGGGGGGAGVSCKCMGLNKTTWLENKMGCSSPWSY